MSFRNLFQAYLKHPENRDDVVFYDDDVVIMKDGYPKSQIHLLVLPRSKHTYDTPQKAFDAEFKLSMEPYIEKARQYLISHWQYEGDSIEDHIIVCCHSVPSMANLHIHVLSDDMFSIRLKNRKHFNSFQTPFAIKWHEMPLPEDDARWDRQYCERLLKQDIVYRGVNYGSSFARVKKAIAANFKATWTHKTLESSP